MGRRSQFAHPHHRRKPSIVPLQDYFELRLLQGLRGSEYLKIIASVEQCAASDMEREKLTSPLDPNVIMGYIRSMATAL